MTTFMELKKDAGRKDLKEKREFIKQILFSGSHQLRQVTLNPR